MSGKIHNEKYKQIGDDPIHSTVISKVFKCQEISSGRMYFLLSLTNLDYILKLLT